MPTANFVALVDPEFFRLCCRRIY